jgi:hypothetical protein
MKYPVITINIIANNNHQYLAIKYPVITINIIATNNH